jgi:hypothetical protein
MYDQVFTFMRKIHSEKFIDKFFHIEIFVKAHETCNK